MALIPYVNQSTKFDSQHWHCYCRIQHFQFIKTIHLNWLILSLLFQRRPFFLTVVTLCHLKAIEITLIWFVSCFQHAYWHSPILQCRSSSQASSSGVQLKTLFFRPHSVLQLHLHEILWRFYQSQLHCAQLWPGGAVPYPFFVGTGNKVHLLKNIDIQFLKCNLKLVERTIIHN